MDKKILYGAGLAVMALGVILILSAAAFYMFSAPQAVGADCGTVSPGFRDECCARQNTDSIAVERMGGWRYDSVNGCHYVCNTEKPIGGERDVNGCLGPAGFSWDSEIGACVRQWEMKDGSTRRAAKIAVDSVGQSYALTVSSYEVLRCPGCYDIQLAAEDTVSTVAVRNWEATGQSTPGSGSEEPVSEPPVVVGPKSCDLAPEPGMCKAAFQRYYFDSQSGECKVFIWGGCGGVVPFETLDECLTECAGAAKENYCTDEQRGAVACTMEYRPVCGWFDPERIQCVKYPCASTYGNPCGACADDKVLYWTNGECPKNPPVRRPAGWGPGYEVAEKLPIECATDDDCETPEDYLIRSSCPYTSICLEGVCTVVCPTPAEITGFDDCVAAGNPVMESYPRQCRTSDGSTFVEEIPE